MFLFSFCSKSEVKEDADQAEALEGAEKHWGKMEAVEKEVRMVEAAE